MIAVITAVVLNIIAAVGFWGWTEYTTEQKIEMCVEKALADNPALHENDVRVACDSVIR